MKSKKIKIEANFTGWIVIALAIWKIIDLIRWVILRL